MHFTLALEGIEAAMRALHALGDAQSKSELLDTLGQAGMEQTRERIETEKTTPEGAPWPKTTDDRAALFVKGEHLARSIDHTVEGDAAIWGSGWIGARIHNFGGVIVPKNARSLRFQIGGKIVFTQRVVIPQREYLGVSSENAEDLLDVARAFFEKEFA